MDDLKLVVQGEDRIALVLDPKDNVAIALTDLQAGDTCLVRMDDREEKIVVTEEIRFGHKFALVALRKDESVYKYGEEIGKMSGPIAKGGWIHNHNLYCERGLK